MIKKLFFTAALFAPALACAGTPSATLPGQIVPAGSDPAVPAIAAAAGFTTLAANFDFVNNTMCVYGTCVAASPVSNWLDCPGTDNTKIWHNNYFGALNSTIPCSAIFLTTDQGLTVLDQQYLVSYAALGNTSNQNTVYMTTNANDGNLTFSYPNGAYIEAVYRINNTWAGGQGSQPNGPYVWQNGGIVHDFQPGELAPGANGFGDGTTDDWASSIIAQYTWRSYTTNSLPAGYTPTSYHKYAGLRTTDGATSMLTCAFVDDILQTVESGRCANNGGLAGSFANRSWLLSASGTGNTGAPLANIDLTFQYIRVWTCAGGQSGQCNGSTFVDTGSGPRYWH
jgi:hypothetical protein